MTKKIELTKSEKILLEQLQQYGPVGIDNPCSCGLVAGYVDLASGRTYCHSTTVERVLIILLERLKRWGKRC